LLTNKGAIEPELIIWTGNPIKLIEYKETSCAENKHFVSETIHGVLWEKVKIPIYIQVFSLKTKVTRIFIYNIESQGRINIEMAGRAGLIDQISDEVNCVLASLNISVRFDLIGKKVSIRRDILQFNDVKLIDNLKFKFDKTNIIYTNYREYSRDSRINNMSFKIKNV